MNTDLGADESMIPELVKGAIILQDGYKVLEEDEIAVIFKESL